MKGYVCKECGSIAVEKTRKHPGNIGKELLLYLLAGLGFLFFVLPGIVMLIIAISYSVKRYTNYSWMCEVCGAKDSYLPLNSPLGAQIAKNAGHDL